MYGMERKNVLLCISDCGSGSSEHNDKDIEPASSNTIKY